MFNGSNKAGNRYHAGVPVEHRHRGTTRDILVSHFKEIIARLGHVPTYKEYSQLPDSLYGTSVYVSIGHRNLIKICGYKQVRVKDTKNPRGYSITYAKITANVDLYITKKRKQNLSHDCMNALDCVGFLLMNTTNKVAGRYQYCEPCKKDRGWYD